MRVLAALQYRSRWQIFRGHAFLKKGSLQRSCHENVNPSGSLGYAFRA